MLINISILVLIILDWCWYSSHSFLLLILNKRYLLAFDVFKFFCLWIVTYFWFLIDIFINAMNQIWVLCCSPSTMIFLIPGSSFTWLITYWLLQCICIRIGFCKLFKISIFLLLVIHLIVSNPVVLSWVVTRSLMDIRLVRSSILLLVIIHLSWIIG